MKTFFVTEADELLKQRGYKYNVQILIDGLYCGIGRYCKNQDEVDEYIEKQKKIKSLEDLNIEEFSALYLDNYNISTNGRELMDLLKEADESKLRTFFIHEFERDFYPKDINKMLEGL